MRASLATLLIASLLAAAPVAGAASALAGLLAATAPTVVSVRLVLKTEMKFGGNAQEQESRLELEGVVVDPAGLVMISNSPLSPARIFALMGQTMEGSEITATPTDIKVILGPEETEYAAFLAATDSKVDLAFVQIEGLGDRRLAAVDFSRAAPLAVGDELAIPSRLGKGFDAAPYLELARITGEIAKPRAAWVVDGAALFGLPAYALDGRVAGVLTTLESGVSAEAAGNAFPFANAMRMLAGGGGMIRPFLLPSAALQGLVQRAREQAAAKAAERARAAASD